jgi:hypothetical protein
MELIMGEIKQAYITELEQRLNDGLNEIRELEARMKKANMESGHHMYIQIQALRQQNDETRALLQTLRESDHSEWQSIKDELEKAWVKLRHGLDKITSGLSDSEP